jgi:hypothetical protein
MGALTKFRIYYKRVCHNVCTVNIQHWEEMVKTAYALESRWANGTGLFLCPTAQHAVNQQGLSTAAMAVSLRLLKPDAQVEFYGSLCGLWHAWNDTGRDFSPNTNIRAMQVLKILYDRSEKSRQQCLHPHLSGHLPGQRTFPLTLLVTMAPELPIWQVMGVGLI